MQSYSSVLCANFNNLQETNRSTNDSFTTTVFNYVCFRAQTTSNILTTTFERLREHFACGKAFLRNALSKLEQLGVIIIVTTINRKGYKRTEIRVKSNEQSHFNHEKLSIIRQHTKDDELSLLYSFVAFKLSAYDKCNQPAWLKIIDEKVWWKLDIKRITEQFSISERTAFEWLKKLLGLNMLEKKRVGIKSYYTIKQETYEKISAEYKASSDFCSKFAAEPELSSINNTLSGKEIDINNNNTRDSDIILNNLDEIGKDLSKRQIAYLLSAIKITMQKFGRRTAGEIQDVFGWIKFSILNPCQRKGITNFKHAVNRFIKLLREQKLTMPFGYNKYTEEGKQFWAEVLNRENKSANNFTSARQEDRKREDVVYEGSVSISDEEWAAEMIKCEKEEQQQQSARVVSGEMSNKETEGEVMQEGAEAIDKRLLNEKAERFAKAVAEKSKEPKSNAMILEYLWRELDTCIEKGADVNRVHEILGRAS